MRLRFGRCTVHSGYRTRQHNSKVGGAPQSYHLWDLRDWLMIAADVSFARGAPLDWARHAISLGAGGVISYPGHVHVDNRMVAFHQL